LAAAIASISGDASTALTCAACSSSWAVQVPRAAGQLERVAGRPERVERGLQLAAADGPLDYAVEVLGCAGALVRDLLRQQRLDLVRRSHRRAP